MGFGEEEVENSNIGWEKERKLMEYQGTKPTQAIVAFLIS